MRNYKNKKQFNKINNFDLYSKNNDCLCLLHSNLFRYRLSFIIIGEGNRVINKTVFRNLS